MDTDFYRYKLRSFIRLKSLSSLSHQRLDKNYVFTGESHSAWEFVYVDSNSINVKIEDKTYTVGHREIIFIAPHLWHEVYGNGADDATIMVASFHFDSKISDFFCNKMFRLNSDCFHLLETFSGLGFELFDTNDLRLFETKLHTKKGFCKESEQLIKNYLEILLITLYNQNTKKSLVLSNQTEGDTDNVDVSILKLLNDSLYISLSLDDICDKLHYGKSFLCKKFKEKHGTSIMSHYMSLKIGESKKYLRFSDISVNELADRLQFCSASHFINTFKKYEGISPKHFAQLITAKMR